MRNAQDFHSRVLLVAAIAAGSFATASQAADVLWRGTLFPNGNWGANACVLINFSAVCSSNWTGGNAFPGRPVNGDSLRFAGTTGLANTNDQWLESVADMRFEAGAGSFVLGGSGLTVNGNVVNASSHLQTIELPLTVGASGRIWDGGTAGLAIKGGLDVGAHELTLTNAITVDVTDEFNLARSGNAALTLKGGSVLNIIYGTIAHDIGSTGTVTVAGPGSAWNIAGVVTLGTAGRSTLEILHGGRVQSAMVMAGTNVKGESHVTVADASSRFDIRDSLTIFHGSLNVLDGGTVTANFAQLGVGTALVDGTGSLWHSNTELRIGGNLGSAVLTIAHGGRVESTRGIVGFDDPGAVVVDGTGSLWVNTEDLSIGGNGEAGALSIVRGGAVLDTDAYVGHGNNNVGTVTVDGPGSTWTNTGTAYVGATSVGKLFIQNGGMTSSADGVIGSEGGGPFVIPGIGTATVEGSGSEWRTANSLQVGSLGQGTLNVERGGRVSDTNGYVGRYASGYGVANVDGNDSAWVSGEALVVGFEGQGTLNVTAGGTVRDRDGIVGREAGSVGIARIDGAGSSWQHDADLLVGYKGRGSLDIGNGGQVVNTAGWLGSAARSSGRVTVDGPGSAWRNSSTIYVGLDGTGELVVQNAGLVSAEELIIGALGRVNLDGGVLDLARSSLIRGAQFDWRAGTLHYTGAAALGGGFAGMSTELALATGQTLLVDGRLTLGEGTTLVRAGGTVKSGSLAIAGGALVADGILDLDDLGDVTGHGVIDGALRGGAGRVLTADGGDLILGRAGAPGGYAFNGTLHVGTHQVELRAADSARLGVLTVIDAGGVLATDRGATLSKGRHLEFTGDASVYGNFVNDGGIVGTLGTLGFFGDVAGAGNFAGNVAFHANYRPGHSPARIDFHGGDVTFEAAATLELELFGAAPGLEHDQLIGIHTFDFEGTLDLVFGGGYAPDAGTTFQLFAFDTFTGSFDRSRIHVTGFDASRLDFSALGTTGTLRVNAVPVPAAAWMFTAALPIAFRRRRAGTTKPRA